MGSFRKRVHRLLRESILDAAWKHALEQPWSQVRIADIADEVGVSRQTIYNEVGTKEQLWMSLFERELERFLDELVQRLATEDHLEGALRSALQWMLEETSGHPLLQRMMRDARAGETDVLLPILTVRSHLIIEPVRGRFVDYVLERWPDVDRPAAEVVVDHLIRFVIGQVITPTDLDRDAMVDAMVSMAVHVRVPEKH